MTLGGLILIVFGVLYVRQPATYRREFWMKTGIPNGHIWQNLYKKYTRGLGLVLIVAGVGLVCWDLGRRFL